MAYIFHPTGKLGQSYLMETEEGAPVFEARCTRMGIFRQSLYQLVDLSAGKEKEISVSHTVTMRQGGDPENDLSEGFVTRSSFKIDGTDVWEILQQKGLSLEQSLEGLASSFNAYRGTERIIRLDPHGAGPLPMPGHYRVTCEEDHMEDAFLVCFIVSRVEFH